MNNRIAQASSNHQPSGWQMAIGNIQKIGETSDPMA
jgi:hypothetical protein